MSNRTMYGVPSGREPPISLAYSCDDPVIGGAVVVVVEVVADEFAGGAVDSTGPYVSGASWVHAAANNMTPTETVPNLKRMRQVCQMPPLIGFWRPNGQHVARLDARRGF